MAFKYEINQKHSYITVTLSGEPVIDEFVDFYEKLMVQIEENKITSILWDVREMDVHQLTSGQIAQAVQFLEKWTSQREGGKSAWVVYDQFSYGMARMLHGMGEARNIFREDLKINITMDIKEAEEWIRS